MVKRQKKKYVPRRLASAKDDTPPPKGYRWRESDTHKVWEFTAYRDFKCWSCGGWIFKGTRFSWERNRHIKNSTGKSTHVECVGRKKGELPIKRRYMQPDGKIHLPLKFKESLGRHYGENEVVWE